MKRCKASQAKMTETDETLRIDKLTSGSAYEEKRKEKILNRANPSFVLWFKQFEISLHSFSSQLSFKNVLQRFIYYIFNKN
jgi:hypothetical protein